MKRNSSYYLGRALRAILAAVLIGLILVPCVAMHGHYFTDEADNCLAGLSILHGGLIYVDYLSQHMPLLYYVCALFAKLGAVSVLSFRVMFYIFLTLLWVVFYLRQEKHFGKVTAIAVPVFYCVNMYAFYASFVLSEHLQGFGLAVLLFEFWRFYDTGRITWREVIWISAGIFSSFGCAFVSAFPIAVIVLGVVILEIARGVKAKEKAGHVIGRLFVRYVPVFLLTAGLLVLLFLPQILAGEIGAAFKGAYQVNRDYYPHYMADSYGASVLGAFIEPFRIYIRTFRDIITVVHTSGEFMRIALCYGINLLYLVYRRKQPLFRLVVTTLFVIMCASRSVGYDFHAIPYFAATMCQLAIMLQEAWNSILGRTKDAWWYRIGIVLVTLGICFFLVFPYAKRIPLAKNLPALLHEQQGAVYENDSKVSQIMKLTDEDEKVILSSIDMYLLVYANRHPVGTASSVPWMYEAYGREMMEELRADPPRVAVYDQHYVLWGYSMNMYCPEFVDFMRDNYLLLRSDMPNLYVRKDYYLEAREISGLE